MACLAGWTVTPSLCHPLTVYRHPRGDVTYHVSPTPPPPRHVLLRRRRYIRRHSVVSPPPPAHSRLLPMEVEASSTGGWLRLATAAALTIDEEEAPERRMEQVIRESPVVVVGRRGCFMCYVMRRLLAAVGAHPTVIVLEEGEAAGPAAAVLPALFIGGATVGGIEGLIALHLRGRLVPRLRAAGA